jgi:hypothetical protein
MLIYRFLLFSIDFNFRQGVPKCSTLLSVLQTIPSLLIVVTLVGALGEDATVKLFFALLIQIYLSGLLTKWIEVSLI